MFILIIHNKFQVQYKTRINSVLFFKFLCSFLKILHIHISDIPPYIFTFYIHAYISITYINMEESYLFMEAVFSLKKCHEERQALSEQIVVRNGRIASRLKSHKIQRSKELQEEPLFQNILRTLASLGFLQLLLVKSCLPTKI